MITVEMTKEQAANLAEMIEFQLTCLDDNDKDWNEQMSDIREKVWQYREEVFNH